MKDLSRPRIKTMADALRCVKALKEYFRRHESPMAAEDLEDAIRIIAHPELARQEQ